MTWCASDGPQSGAGARPWPIMGPWTTTSCSTSATVCASSGSGHGSWHGRIPRAEGSRGEPRPRGEDATLTYESRRGWTGPDNRDPWQIGMDGLTVELRPTETGQVGLFPEQQGSWAWLRDRVAQGMAVLNLFAYTGLATLVAAAEGASVVHVDASRPTVAWARRNAELSGLAERPVRWIVDDAQRPSSHASFGVAGASTASFSTRRVTATARGVVGGGSRTTSLPCSARLPSWSTHRRGSCC